MEKEWKAYEIGELDQYLFGTQNSIYVTRFQTKNRDTIFYNCIPASSLTFTISLNFKIFFLQNNAI